MAFGYTLEDIIDQMRAEGIEGVQPVITDYDWNDDYRGESTARVTIWLKREDNDD